MKRYILLSLLFINSLMLSSQTHYIDSLENVLKQHAEKDTTRIELLNSLVYELQETDHPRAMKYAEEAIEIATKLNDQVRKVDALRMKGIVNGRRGNFEESLKYFKDALELAKETEDDSRTALCYLNVGMIYGYLSNYPNAIENYQLALTMSEETKDSATIMRCYNSMGSYYYAQGNYPKAIEYIQKSYSLSEKFGQKRDMATSLNNMANLEYLQENYSSAIEYFLKALEIDEELGSIGGMAATLNNIAIIYKQQEKYSEAMEYYEKAMELRKQVGDRQGLASSLLGLGTTFSYLGDFNKSFEYLEEAMPIAEEVGDKVTVCFIKLGMSIVYVKTNEYKKALAYALESYEIAKQLELIDEIKKISGVLAEIYAELGSYKNAYEYHKTHKELNDSLFNKENIKKMANLSAQYKFEKEKQAMEHEQMEKELIAEKEKAKQVALRNTFMTGFGFVFILAIIIFMGLRRNKKRNKELEELNEEIQSQKELILSQNEELTITNEKLVELDRFKEAMTGMIVHDLKNPLNAILNTSPEEDGLFVKRVRNSGRQMLNMVLNILDLQKYEYSTMKLELHEEELNSVIENGMEEVRFLCEEKNISLQTGFKGHVLVQADQAVLNRIVVNLLTNAIKYSPNNESIIIKTKPQGNTQIRVEVCDNGPGITKEQHKKIFNRFAQQQAKDSGKIQSTGLGLAFCKLAIKAHNGKIGVDSEQGNGSCFWFTLPTISQSNMQETIGTNKRVALPELTPAEILRIKQSLIKLKAARIYQISQLRKILAEIDDTQSENIKQWKAQVKKAISTEDKETFEILIDINVKA